MHLADRLEEARVASAAAPERDTREWVFTGSTAGWSALDGERDRRLAHVALAPGEGALGIAIGGEGGSGGDGPPTGGIAIELEPTPLGEWTGILVRARSRDRFAGMGVVHNLDEEGAIPGLFHFFMGGEGVAPVFNDGSTQTYHLPFAPRAQGETLRSLGLVAAALGPGRLEVLSIALVPRGADFAASHGVRPVTRAHVTRRTLFAHAPAALAWNVRVPAGGRLDLALACLPGETVRYRAVVRAGKQEKALAEEVADATRWHEVSLDLAALAGQEAELVLEAESDAAGAVALLGTPLLSGAPPTAASGQPRVPNVIFYVIDGGGADLMSLYGYERETTPFLAELAKEGVVFERAYSSSTWTQPSTASFMTGLHHSVLGGLRRGVHSTPIPEGATTMAEHLRQAGFLTASFTANPNAGRVIGLERGIDYLSDAEPEDHATSSVFLHEAYFDFRRRLPAEPCWVHFQTVDVHEPNQSRAPFAGKFVPAEERARVERWEEELWTKAGDLFGTTSIADFYDRALERAEIDRKAYYETRRGLYDETMAHQDRELGRLVERLKASGEWEHTLLVIGSDHGHPAGTFSRWGRGLIEPRPEGWQGALFDAYAAHVPLVFVWPGAIAGGRRCAVPVSMIDVLPTLLDLLGLPPPEVLQGRSLAPYLRGGELAPRELLFDEFRVDEASGAMIGNLELIDGKWGASLEIGPGELGRHSVPAGGRWGAVHPFFADRPRLLLYDLEQDPFATRAVNAEHPELVARYEQLLRERWEAHQLLAERFQEGESA
ncbi:MAG TPA: sulfatase-like hydrolase/transferase, partial [Planctomycetota bacterium]